MMFMALDHALYFWSFGRISNEGLPLLKNGVLSFYGGGSPSGLAYAVMVLSSISAPGFLFIAGYVLALSFKRREEAGVSSRAIRKHIWQRSLVLIASQVFVASPAFNLPYFINGTIVASLGVFLSLSVLSTIGIGFLFLDLGRYISAWRLLAFSIVMYLLSEIFLPHFASVFPHLSWAAQGLQSLLLQPVPFSGRYVLNSNFPVIPWLFPLSLGWFYGKTYESDKGFNYEGKRFGLSALVSLGLFFVLRALGLGDFLPVTFSGRFFILSKYPPSPDYFLFYLGIVFTLLFLFIRLPSERRVFKVLDDLGKGSLFFYNAHLWLYAAIPALFNRFNRLPIWEGTGVWLLGLCLLYPLTCWYVKLRGSLKAALKLKPTTHLERIG